MYSSSQLAPRLAIHRNCSTRAADDCGNGNDAVFLVPSSHRWLPKLRTVAESLLYAGTSPSASLLAWVLVPVVLTSIFLQSRNRSSSQSASQRQVRLSRASRGPLVWSSYGAPYNCAHSCHRSNGNKESCTIRCADCSIAMAHQIINRGMVSPTLTLTLIRRTVRQGQGIRVQVPPSAQTW